MDPPAVLRLAHLSDVHLAPMPRVRPSLLLGKRLLGWLSWTLRRRHLHRRAVLDAVVADMRRQAPDHVLVTGDLVNISLPEEYTQAARWLAELAPPERVLLVPGNHDAYVAGAAEAGWIRWAPWMGGENGGGAAFPWLRRLGAAAVLGLSTAVPTPPGYASGRLGEEQLRGLERRLRQLAAEGLFRIVLLHHPPLPVSRPRKALEDREAFCAVIRSAGAELVLSGHEHRFHEGRLAGPDGPVPAFVAPSASLLEERPEKRGGYLLFQIGRRSGGWRVTVRLRRHRPTGTGLEDTLEREIDLPRATGAATAGCVAGGVP